MGNDLQIPMTSKQNRRQLLVSRQKSLSDGSLPSPTLKQPPEVVEQRPTKIVNIPARDLASPDLQGYVERATPGDNTIKDWESVWCVLKDACLYVYGSPIDEAAKDCVELPGWSVHEYKDASHPYCLQLTHPSYHAEYLAMEKESELAAWLHDIHQVAQKVSIEGLSLEHGRSDEFDKREASAEQEQFEEELLVLRKRQLLKLVLQQKDELEQRLLSRDDSERGIDRGRSASLGGRLLRSEGNDPTHDITLLKQRRVSTRLKADNVQRQLQGLQEKRTKKKSRFSLGGLMGHGRSGGGVGHSHHTGETPLLQEGALEEELHELTQKLEGIEQDLSYKQQFQTTPFLTGVAPTMTSSTSCLVSSATKLGIPVITNAALSSSADCLASLPQQQKVVSRSQSAMLPRIMTDPVIARTQSSTSFPDKSYGKSNGKHAKSMKALDSRRRLSHLPEAISSHEHKVVQATSSSKGASIPSTKNGSTVLPRQEISQSALSQIEDFEQLIAERLHQTVS